MELAVPALIARPALYDHSPSTKPDPHSLQQPNTHLLLVSQPLRRLQPHPKRLEVPALLIFRSRKRFRRSPRLGAECSEHLLSLAISQRSFAHLPSSPCIYSEILCLIPFTASLVLWVAV